MPSYLAELMGIGVQLCGLRELLSGDVLLGHSLLGRSLLLTAMKLQAGYIRLKRPWHLLGDAFFSSTTNILYPAIANATPLGLATFVLAFRGYKDTIKAFILDRVWSCRPVTRGWTSHFQPGKKKWLKYTEFSFRNSVLTKKGQYFLQAKHS